MRQVGVHAKSNPGWSVNFDAIINNTARLKIYGIFFLTKLVYPHYNQFYDARVQSTVVVANNAIIFMQCSCYSNTMRFKTLL